jgi:hypothetical protein
MIIALLKLFELKKVLTCLLALTIHFMSQLLMVLLKRGLFRI